MATFKAQVETWVGTVSDTTALDFWLQSAAKFIINILPTRFFEESSTATYDDGMGSSTSGYRVLSANKNGFPAKKIASTQRGVFADDTSLHYATAKSPVFYTDKELTYVLPDGGEIQVIQYPAVLNTDSDIPFFPDSLEPAVSLWAATQVKIKALTTSIAALVATTLTLPSVPAALSGTPTTIAAFGSVPTFTAPPLGTLESVLDDLDISSIPAPIPPDVTFEALADLVPFTFAPPTIDAYTNAESSITTDQDIELGQAYLQKIQTQLQEYQQKLQNSFHKFQGDLETYKTENQRSIEQVRSDLQLFATNIQKYQSQIQAQVEVYVANINKITSGNKTLLERYGSDILIAWDVYQAALEVYKASVQRAITQAQIDENRAIEVVRTNIQSYMAASQAVVSEFQSKIQFYHTQVADGNAQISVMKQQFNDMLAPYLPPPPQPRYIGRGVTADQEA